MKYIFSLFRFFSFIFTIGALITLLLDFTNASPAAFATPLEIARTIPEFFVREGYLFDLLGTIYRTIIAFLLAIPIGILAAATAIFARKVSLGSEMEFLIDFLRSVPATALVPVFLIIFGPGGSSKVGVGAFTGSLSIALSVLVGFKALSLTRARAANMIGLSGFQRLFYYEMIEILPAVMVGARTAASLCLILVIVGEMFIGSGDGIGRVIMDKRYSDDVPAVYAAIFIAGIVGYALNALLAGMERILPKP